MNEHLFQGISFLRAGGKILSRLSDSPGKNHVEREEQGMECKGSGGNRNEAEKMWLERVDCEICGRFGWLAVTHPGVYICARCHRDIVSSHIHD